MNVSFHPSHQLKKGAILIIVLWISTGLVMVSLLFGQSMMLSYRAGDYTFSGLQAEQAIEGAGRYISYSLRNGVHGEFDPTETFRAEWVSVGDAKYWIVGRSENLVYLEYPAFGLVDESSKLNVNTATLEMLEKLPDMTPEFAAAIIDWRDEDEDITEGGAESETYLLRRPGYESKNAFFETPEELLLVQYADWQLLFGEDANLNGFMDINEHDGEASLPLDDQDTTLKKGILDYVTVYSRHSNLKNDGTPKVNISSSESAEDFTALLEEKFGADRAAELSGVTAGNTQFDSLAQFWLQSGMTDDEFDQIDQDLSISEEPYTEGLVNINTAPYEVLVCLPGLDETTAQQIVNYRTTNYENLKSFTWLREVLEESVILTLGVYITAQNYQYSADIAAVGNDGKGYRRVQFIIDNSDGTPVVRYRRDLTRLGWALGESIRQELNALKETGNEFVYQKRT